MNRHNAHNRHPPELICTDAMTNAMTVAGASSQRPSFAPPTSTWANTFEMTE